MKFYTVGGFVRDTILGLDPKDRDVVVVGATPEEMVKKGYKPAGKDFPVFLHPDTHEEYALARLERKIAPGSNGFSTDIRNVRLEDDLMRRDLTINAMAMDKNGLIIDPYNGRDDINRKVFRHVSDAFSEDPLRVLRVARFHARYGYEWTIAPETLKLMKSIVASDDMDAITQERVWVEFDKGLKEKNPELMLACLSEVGLFDRPRYATYKSGKAPDLLSLSEAVARDEHLSIRTIFSFPSLANDIDANVHRIPSDIRDVVKGYATAVQNDFFEYDQFSPDEKLKGILSLDGLRQADRLDLIIRALDCVQPGIAEKISSDVRAAKSIDRTAVIGIEKNGLVIKDLIYQAQMTAIENNLTSKNQLRI